jgi:hypothetical protein
LHLCLSSLSVALADTERPAPAASSLSSWSPLAAENMPSREAPVSAPAALEAGDEFGSLWMAADAGRSRSRAPGRRGRCQEGEGELRAAEAGGQSACWGFCPRWLWMLCAVALLLTAPTAVAQVQSDQSQPLAPAAGPPPYFTPRPLTPAGLMPPSVMPRRMTPLAPGAISAQFASAEPTAQLVARRQPGRDPRDGGGEQAFPRRPFVGSPNVVVTDPAEYPRPEILENNDPSSFWYSLRPNIFNVPVEPEWDFYNIINTDRPDFTDAVYSVGKGVTILETGYTYHKFSSAAQRLSTRQLPESLLRYGITNEFELRLKWPGYLMTDSRDPTTGAHTSTFGSQDIDVGFKYEIIQQRGWLPMTTLVSGIFLPTGSRGLSANRVQPHFNIVAGWGFRRWLYLKWQTGADFLNATTTQPISSVGSSVPAFTSIQTPQNSWHDSLSLLTQWTKRVGAFHEWFLISGTGAGDTRAANYLDMGLYLYATPNIQFDARIGTRLSNRVHETFTGVGFSGRW